MSFLRDRKGQLLTLDLLLALVPLTIILGMSASAMGGVVNQIQEYSLFYSMQRQAADAADVLIKTPGVPPNWNSTNPPTTPGLAVYSCNRALPNFLDYDKLLAIDGTMLATLIANGTNVYFEAVNLQTNTTIKTLTYNTTGVSMENAANVFGVERIVTLGMNTSSSTALTYNATNIDKDTINWNLDLPSCPEIKNITILLSTGGVDGEYIKFKMKKPPAGGGNEPHLFIGDNFVSFPWDDAIAYDDKNDAENDVRQSREDATRFPEQSIDIFLRGNLVVGANEIKIDIDVKNKPGGGSPPYEADINATLNIAYSIPVPVEGKVILKIWR